MADHPAISRLTLDQKRKLLFEAIEKDKKQPICKFPLSYGQRALWFLNQVAPDNAAYNVFFRASITSPLEPAIMERAVQAIVDRHHSLRTTYEAGNGRPVQTVHRVLRPMYERLIFELRQRRLTYA